MLTKKTARERIEASADVLQNISLCRAQLSKHDLTRELFDELNGEDRGLETMLGHVIVCDFEDLNARYALRKEIIDGLQKVEDKISVDVRAALECYVHDLVSTVQEFDASHEEMSNIRTKLIGKINMMSDDEKKANLTKKCDFECFTFQAAKDVCDAMAAIGHYLETKEVDVEKLKELACKQGGDMTDADNEFLNKLEKTLKAESLPRTFLCHAPEDRVTGATLEALGFDCDKIAVLAKNLSKAEEMFFTTVRAMREALCHPCDTTSEVAVRNTRFWDVMDDLGSMIAKAEVCRRLLAEQLSLFLKLVLDITDEGTKKEGADVGTAKTEGDHDKDKATSPADDNQKTEEEKKDEGKKEGPSSADKAATPAEGNEQ